MTNNTEMKPESPEESARRMVHEEEEVFASSSASHEGNRDVLEDLLKKKHEAELAIGHPFKSMLEYQRYAAHKIDEDEHFAPDPKGILEQGQLIAPDTVFLGVDEEGNGVVGILSTDASGTQELQEGVVSLEELYDVVVSTEGSDALSEHESTTQEPPAEIATVAAPPVIEAAPSETEFAPVDQIVQHLEEMKEQQKQKAPKAPSLADRILAGESMENMSDAFLRGLLERKNEELKKIVEEELAKREAKQKEVTKTEAHAVQEEIMVLPATHGPTERLKERVIAAVNEGRGATVPEDLQRKFREEPEVAAYLEEHPLSPALSGAASEVVQHSQGISGRMIDNLLDAGREFFIGKNKKVIPLVQTPTAEEPEEIRATFERKKAREALASEADLPADLPTGEQKQERASIDEEALVIPEESKQSLENTTLDQQALENFENEGGGMAIAGDVQLPVVSEKQAKTIDPMLAATFERTLGVDAAIVNDVEGFADLPRAKQRLIFEQMKGLVAEEMHVEGIKRYRAQIDTLAKSDKWMDKLKGGALRATKAWQIGKSEDAAYKDWLAAEDFDAAQMKREALEGLVENARQTATFGVEETPEGLRTLYISESDVGAIDEETRTQLEQFNTIANAYARAPGGDVESAKELAKEYRRSADEMTKFLAEKGGWNEAALTEWRTQLESAVTMSRFFDANPELNRELSRAGQNVGAALGFKNFFIERLTYMAGSAGARVASALTLGAASLPLVAVASAGIASAGGAIMGWRRAKQELSENDLLAQMGEEIKGPAGTEKHIVSGTTLLEKLEVVIGREEQAEEVMDLLGGWEREGWKDKSAQVRRSLEARVAYIIRHLEEGRVDLGNTVARRAQIMSKLALALGRAQTMLAFTEFPEETNKVTERIDHILDVREEQIEQERKKHLVKQALKGAAYGVAFSTAGSLIGSLFQEVPVSNTGSMNAFSVPQEAIEPGIPLATYVAEGNEELSMVLKAHVPELSLTFHSPAAQDEAIRSLLKVLTPEELHEIGLQTEATHLVPGQTLNLEKLNQFLREKTIDGENIIIRADRLYGYDTPDHVPEFSAKEITPTPLELTARTHTISSGENLTTILKAHVPALQSLSSFEKENAIQNLLASLSPLELEAVGLVNGPDKLAVGQTLDLEKFSELFQSKQIAGEDLITHAAHLSASEGTPTDLGVPESPQAPISPRVEETLPPPSETAVISSSGEVNTPVEVNVSGEHSRVLEAQRYGWSKEDVEAAVMLEQNVEELLGSNLVGKLPRAWIDIREHDAEALLSLTPEQLAIRPDAETITRLREFIAAHELNEAHGYVPSEHMTIEEFLRISLMRKKLAEGHF